ncbi:MAG: c-type cytochrome [Verrucomicrobia bacterium]|nr:c-type cytochrome [Verrucomicrobiota bacterium]
MRKLWWQLSFGCVTATLAGLADQRGFSQALVWDATSKFYDAKRGQTNTVFVFHLTNTSHWKDVEINGVSTTCGCTLVKRPASPWILPPGGADKMEIQVDLRGKQGLLSKMTRVVTSSGVFEVAINVYIPDPTPEERQRMFGILVAQADRQAVFQGDCAKCHVQPAVGKKGAELYKAACSICHEAKHRAEMVPDLAAVKTPTDRSYWETWVRNGKPGTLMPAFSKAAEGPLDEEQIRSLAEYLSERFRPSQAGGVGNHSPAKVLGGP